MGCTNLQKQVGNIFLLIFFLLLGPEDCPETCPSNYDPVCGSDGNNYQNECYLKNIKCLENKPDLSVDFEGLWQYRLWIFKFWDTKLERQKIIEF